MVDLEPRVVRVAVLASMLGVFGMAFAVPTAFEGDGNWLAFGYVLVRVIAAAVMVYGTREDPVEMRAVMTYLPVSLGATAIVLVGGLVGGDALQWIWLASLALELGLGPTATSWLATCSVGRRRSRCRSPTGVAR